MTDNFFLRDDDERQNVFFCQFNLLSHKTPIIEEGFILDGSLEINGSIRVVNKKNNISKPVLYCLIASTQKDAVSNYAKFLFQQLDKTIIFLNQQIQ